MSPGDALMVQQLRELGELSTKLASDLETGKLWPGQLCDGLRKIRDESGRLNRAVEDARPRPSRGSRW